jgi:hypothetical protein
LIARAVADGAIGPRDGELVLQTRVDGVALSELAQTIGSSYGALRKRRERTEASLRGWLRPHNAAASRDVAKRGPMVLNSDAPPRQTVGSTP